MQVAVERQGQVDAQQARAIAVMVAGRAGTFEQALAWHAGQRRGLAGGKHLLPGLVRGVGFIQRWVERRQVGGHGLQVLVRQRGQPLDDRRHRSSGNAMLLGVAGAQVAVQLVRVPGHGRAGKRRQRGRLPAIDHGSRQVGGARGPLGTQHIARRVAGAAMADAIHEVGAAVPCGGLRGAKRLVGRRRRVVEQAIP